MEPTPPTMTRPVEVIVSGVKAFWSRKKGGSHGAGTETVVLTINGSSCFYLEVPDKRRVCESS